MPVNVNEREYRLINVAMLEVREAQDGRKTVEGYATTFDQEYKLWGDASYQVMESVDRHAFDKADMSDVIMQYDHEGRVFARIANGTLEVEPDEKGLHIRAKLGGTEIGRQLYEEIAGGYTSKMSFGFTVTGDKVEQKKNEEEGRIEALRTITKIGKLYDVSAVSLPANDATTISARNFCEGVIAEIREELAEREKRERQKQLIKFMAKEI